jgi:hypothetical protein
MTANKIMHNNNQPNHSQNALHFGGGSAAVQHEKLLWAS